jgi:tetratricopeptide (TPR) repeat protein
MGNLEGALGDYDEILSRTPDDPQARVNRGTVQLMRRAAEPAIEDFTAVLEARPMYAMAYGKRASGEMMRGRPWAAWLDAMTALATGGEDWPHREPISRMLHAAHQALDGTQHAKASAHDVAVRLDLLRTKATGSEVVRFIDLLGENLPSELLDLHLLRGKAYTDYGRWDEAGAAYRDALAFDDGHAGAWLGVGRALVHLQAFEDATAALQRAADGREQLSESDRFELALAQGRVAGAQQRLVEAVGHFDAALTLQPERADVWFYKGVHLDLAGDREGALGAYNESITRNHTFAPAWFNRACEHSVLGHRSEALDDLRRAVALDPSWGPAAAKDDYFASLWSDPEFQEVVASGGGA